MIRRQFCALTGVLLAFTSLIGLAGCSDGGSTNPNDSSRVRAINLLNAAPNTADTTIRVAQRGAFLTVQSVPFRSAGLAGTVVDNTPYGVTAAGSNIDTFVFSGTQGSPASTGALNADAPTKVDFANNFAYSLVGVGTQGTTGNTSPRVLRLDDSFPTGWNQQTEGLVRIVHAAPGAPNISAFRTTAANIEEPLAGSADLEYLEATRSENTGYARLAPGTYNVVIRTTAAPNSALALASFPNGTIPITVTAGRAQTIFVFGLLTPGTGQQALDAGVFQDFVPTL